ncbi:hypothetical protein ADICEAN_01096 [Cesiribacter andamanensis AMV16]|uniref:DUF2905 domain-containing protein n=2 Tax=Cesiribacter TaxID=1133570 RepID=M7N575_9BACT|nr:hypothetical protein ADICEAN_01096 [Cesiribacter andamanensis AMV16]
MIMGGLLLLAGVVLYFFDRLPFGGHLPGDFVVKKKGFTLYFPLATSLVLSLLLSLVLWLIMRFR